jgi:hypothetical protein
MSVKENLSIASGDLVEDPQFKAAAILLETNKERFSELVLAFLKNGQVQYEVNGVVLLYSKEGRGCTTRISEDGGFNYSKKSWHRIGLRKRTKILQLCSIFAVREAMTLQESNG